MCVSPKFPEGCSKREFLAARCYASAGIRRDYVISSVKSMAGDVICLKFALKVTHPVGKRRFRQISLNSAAAIRASGKSLMSTMRLPSSHRWTPCVTPNSPEGWLKTRNFTFGVAFHFFLAGNRRHFKFGMWVEHSKSQPTDDKLSLKRAWSLSRDLSNFWQTSDNSITVQDSLIVSVKFE